jgi:hypothetical protein
VYFCIFLSNYLTKIIKKIIFVRQCSNVISWANVMVYG